MQQLLTGDGHYINILFYFSILKERNKSLQSNICFTFLKLSGYYWSARFSRRFNACLEIPNIIAAID